MTPTPKLRFVERSIGFRENVKLILQQWWAIEREGQLTPHGEWRDVPTEVEQ